MDTEFALTEMPLLAMLSPMEFAALADLLPIHEFNPGETIIEQGKLADGLHLIAKGKVQVITCLPADQKLPLAELNAGDFFGELVLIERDLATATVLAETNTTCYILTAECLDAIQFCYADMAHKIIMSIAQSIAARMRSVLQEFPVVLEHMPKAYVESFRTLLIIDRYTESIAPPNTPGLSVNDVQHLVSFAGLDKSEIAILLRYLEPITIARRQSIFVRNDATHSCFIVLSGAVQMTYEHAGQMAKLAVSGPGYVFGDVSFFDGLPRAVTTIAREPVTFLEMSRRSMQMLLQANPKLAYKFHYILVRFLAVNLQQTYRHLVRLKSEVGDHAARKSLLKKLKLAGHFYQV